MHVRLASYRVGPRARVATLLLAVVAACAGSADDALGDAFGVDRPRGVRVEHYEGSFLHRDGWDVWVLAPADEAFLERLVTAARLTRGQPGASQTSGLVSDWPSWWQPTAIEALPEVYYRDEPRAQWRIWVDRRQGRLYVQWFGL